MDRLGPDADRIFASKHALTSVLGCETRFLAERDFPGWSVPLARGTVVHKAIELSINWRGDVTPGQLVDEALANLEYGDRAISDFVAGLREGERAQLRGDAVDLVTKFTECWPPLDRKWRPVTESNVRLELFDGTVLLQGKIDLTLGVARGNTAGKVLVDLKSGAPRPSHLDDLRFYALVEAIRIGVPPRQLATYYLDQGRFHPENVTEELLFTTTHRVIDGVGRMIELELDDRDPTVVPSGACRYCAALPTCDKGQISLREFDDPLDELD